MSRAFKTCVTALSALSIAVADTLPALAGQGVTAADYEACAAGDEEAFRTAIEQVTVKALSEELKGVDYAAAVAIEWRRLGLDSIIDKRVDAAVEEVRNEESWGGLIRSLGNQEKAQELALAVADRVYRSEEMRKAIEDLATAVGTEAGRRIELASQDAAGPALTCLKTFLGPRYGDAVASAVTGDASREFGLEASKGGAELSSGAVLKQSSEGITGAAILLMRRQLANMAQRLGQRLAGSVLSRLVSVAAGGVGLVLIAKDIWDLRHGVLPIIADEMKAKGTKEKVREELASSLAHEIGVNLKDIAANSAAHVLEVWKEFRRAHAKAIELAERDADFKRYLSGIRPASFARLDEVLALVLAAEGEAGILERTRDGTLAVAVDELPEAGMSIARETGSIRTALAWRAVAGGSLSKVVENEVYKHARPEDFSEGALARVLALGERLAITRLAAVEPQSRSLLLELDGKRLQELAASFDSRELETLAGYLKGLERAPRERVLEAISAAPASMRTLGSPSVRDSIIASPDQAAAVDMMLRPGAGSLDEIYGDFTSAWEGRISPSLLWAKHPLAILMALLAALVVLLWLKRLVSPARPTPPVAPSPR